MPAESLEQIASYDVEKLLSKSSELSKNLLLQLRQSLTKEWGSGSIGTLSEDSIQNSFFFRIDNYFVSFHFAYDPHGFIYNPLFS